MEISELINRINELARKKRETGLTPEEQTEQKRLYRIYIDNIKCQLKGHLDKIEFADPGKGQ